MVDAERGQTREETTTEDEGGHACMPAMSEAEGHTTCDIHTYLADPSGGHRSQKLLTTDIVGSLAV